jgi:hypothetical protein
MPLQQVTDTATHDEGLETSLLELVNRFSCTRTQVLGIDAVFGGGN